MVDRSKLTNNSDETDVNRLLSGDTIFSIPFFQRPYKWKMERVEQLHDDILRAIDDDDLHFLGALIVHGRKSNPSEPNLYDVIDGQQRITTLFLYLCAVVKVLADAGELDEAEALFQKYIIIPRNIKNVSNLKIHSCKEDRCQMNHVITDMLANKKFAEKLGDQSKLKPLPNTGKDRGRLRSNYKKILRLLDDQLTKNGIQMLREIYKAVLSSISLVQIDVFSPENGPKIFDSLNSKQEPMTIGDLIRNEIFSKVASENTETLEEIDEHNWQPFYKKFEEGNKQNLFENYFFPYGLIKNHNLKKSEVFHYLRQEWKNIEDPSMIIEDLSKYQNAFIDFVSGSNLQEHSTEISALIRNFHLFGAPGSVVPFALRLSNSIKENVLSAREAKEVLEVVESFLIRRALCQLEPTGLHAVFKRLWSDCNSKPTKDSVIAKIKSHKTVPWPNDDEVIMALTTKNGYYGASITPYFLFSYDKSQGGDTPENKGQMEHVLPQKPTKEWKRDFSDEEIGEYLGSIGNLVLLSPRMNSGLSNKSFEEKRKIYKTDSHYKSTRVFAEKYEVWTPKEISSRSKELAKWAVKRWKY
jgi:hypothetical protein